MKLLKKTAWVFLAFFAISIGLYPLSYLLVDMSGGLFATKSSELLASQIWKIGFYTHISFGGIALLIGWTQFSQKLRTKRLHLHRLIGKIYIVSVLISGVAGLYVAFYATGGLAAQLGFGMLAVFWLYMTIMALQTIKKKEILAHRNWMIRSYGLCMAAITLRLWIPIFAFGFGTMFEQSYPIIAWLCWVPNLILAEILVCQLIKKERNISDVKN